MGKGEQGKRRQTMRFPGVFATGRTLALWHLLCTLIAMLASSGQPLQAQTFTSGSNGSDGALTLTTPGTIIFDPRTFNPPLDPDGDNVYHFTTITIGAGVTVRLLGSQLNGPVFWLATGAVQVAGSIDLNGANGHTITESFASRTPAVPGAGGYAGSIGGNDVSPPLPGSGPGGGPSGAGAFHGNAGSGSFTANIFLVPLIGGSGGGGGQAQGQTTSFGFGGGAGGGAILIASSTSITVNGTIQANGGSSGTTNGFSSGGGGSGGAIRLAAPIVNGTGTLSVQRGSALDGGGSDGRVRIEDFERAFNGNVVPSTSRIIASPFAVLLPPPTPVPSVRVVSVAGVPVPPSPTSSITMPDVTINTPVAVPLAIEARNIPPGTVVELHIYSETGTGQVVNATPLVGTLALSTATATFTFPSGFSQGFVRATWTP
jgi:hypothetical protein